METKQFQVKIFIPYGGQIYLGCDIAEQDVVFREPDLVALERMWENVRAPTAVYYPDKLSENKALLEKAYEVARHNAGMLFKSEYLYMRLGNNYTGPLYGIKMRDIPIEHQISIEFKLVMAECNCEESHFARSQRQAFSKILPHVAYMPAHAELADLTIDAKKKANWKQDKFSQLEQSRNNKRS